MTFIILAAGKGVRANSEDMHLPKVLLKHHNGKSLLVNNLEKNKAHSWDNNIHIVVGFLHNQIQEEIASYQMKKTPQNIKIIHNKQYERGVITSLYQGIRNLNENVVIMNGDTFYSDDVFKQLNYINKSTLLVTPKQNLVDSVKVHAVNNKILNVGKNLQKFSHLSIGCLYLEKAHTKKTITILENLVNKDSIEKFVWHSIINTLTDTGEQISIREVQRNYHFEIDTQQDYQVFLSNFDESNNSQLSE